METTVEVIRPECPVVRLEIEPHPDADRLELAKVGGYRAVVQKGQFQTGDLAAYIPEGSIVPDYLLERLSLTGRLAGKEKNRVKAIRLRGVLSQGLVVPMEEHANELGKGSVYNGDLWGHFAPGQDAAEWLGIEKYVPPVPVSMSGEVWSAGQGRTLGYDIENIKRYPDIFQEREPVVLTETLHGSFVGIGVLPGSMADPEHGDVVIFSKGLGAKGLAFKMDAEHPNIYVRAAHDNDVAKAIRSVFFAELRDYEVPVFVLGEVFGAGVQDLHYGADSRSAGRLGFRVFDIYIGQRGMGYYLDDKHLRSALSQMGIERVPVLYRGPYSDEVLDEYTNGRETVSGTESHVREGIVVRPTVERHDDRIGRVQLKSVSEAYLERGGEATEYN